MESRIIVARLKSMEGKRPQRWICKTVLRGGPDWVAKARICCKRGNVPLEDCDDEKSRGWLRGNNEMES